MSQFISVDNGKKTLDFGKIERRFNTEVAYELKTQIDFCDFKNIDWGIKRIGESKHYETFALITHSCSWVHRIPKKHSRNAYEFFFLDHLECEQMLMLMNQFVEKS